MVLYLVNPSTEDIRRDITDGVFGQMCTPAEGRQPLPEALFAGDNGCYGGKFPGVDPWYRWLTLLVAGRQERCLFAVAPDEFNPHHRDDMGRVSLRRSLPFLADIRVLGVPVALVAQNGLTAEMVPWSEIDVVFLGGCRHCRHCGWWPTFDQVRGSRCPKCGQRTQEWKLSAQALQLANAATEHGKRIHMGRGNSLRRRRIAQVFGCDTMDGTLLVHGPDKHLPAVRRWDQDTPNLFDRAQDWSRQ